jgi:hypothetical protein
MIIRSENSRSENPVKQNAAGQCIPAWQAVEAIQKASSDEYWVVTQPDHARLSGAIAASFDRRRFPLLTPVVIEAIGLHDEGWAQFEGTAAALRKPARSRDGKPLTFLDAAPETFLKAWAGSIHAASRTSPAGEYIVSAHFRLLAECRLKHVIDPPESSQRILDFCARETKRQCELIAKSRTKAEDLDHLLLILQFCDLISLAICAGSHATIEFPQDLGEGNLQMERIGAEYRLHPTPVMAAELAFPTVQLANEPLPKTVEFRLS